MHGGLFVPHQHVLDAVLLVQRVVDVQHRAAGVAPDVLDAFGLQARTRISAPRSSVGVWGSASELAAAAEVISAFEISMINLSGFGNEKPWVPLRALS